MKKYTLHQNYVDIIEDEGITKRIYFNENSGKVYFRYKIGSVIGIKHPGIFLGVDLNGIEYFLHNHYYLGGASLVTGNEFKQGMPIELYKLEYTNPPLLVIKIALEQAIKKERYNVVNYNCQIYVNVAANNQRKSESVERIGRNLFLATIALLGYSLLKDND